MPPYQSGAAPPSAWAHIREGLAYVRSDRRIVTIVQNIAALSILGYPFLVLMPVVARDVLHRGAVEFGWMSAAVGAGAMCGALLLAAFSRELKKGRVLRNASLAFGIVLAAFALSRSLPLSLLLLGLTGFAMIVNTATTNSLLQTLTPDHMRGRVMSVFTLAFVGMGPVGAFQAGYFADRFGAPAVMAVGGILCTLSAAVAFARVKELRELR
jgi:predicted MFS family arabinose efflux permease